MCDPGDLGKWPADTWPRKPGLEHDWFLLQLSTLTKKEITSLSPPSAT